MRASNSAIYRWHWDAVYDAKGAGQVSWFQPEPVVSLALIDELWLDPIEPVIDVGGGAAVLVDRLLERGYTGPHGAGCLRSGSTLGATAPC